MSLFLFVLLVSNLNSEIIYPSKDQTKILRGEATVENGLRLVTGGTDHTGHGPITYYNVPFHEGSFSLSWKLDQEQKTLFVFDTNKNDMQRHILKVYVNGSNNKKETSADTLTLITYDGSTASKKNARITKHKFHAPIGQWNDIKVTFNNREAIVTINDSTFKVQSDRFEEGIENCGIGHFTNRLFTKDVSILK